MRVAFYLDNEDAQLRALGRLAVAAVREHLHDVEVIHLTSKVTRAMEGADVLLVSAVQGGLAHRRASVNALVPGPCLFLDVDCIVQPAIRQAPYLPGVDLALPLISDPHVKYTGGVAYSGGPAFWKAWADETADIDHPDALAHLKHLQAFIGKWTGNVVALKEAQWERLPKSAIDPCEGAYIAHYRGPRKAWLLDRHA